MFWQRSKPTASITKPSEQIGSAEGRSEPKSEGERPAADDLERALDALASVLRSHGKYAFDLPDLAAEEVGADCEGWASHLLLRVPPPGAGAGEDSDHEERRQVSRDWPGAARYLTGLRKHEHSHLTKALGDLRQVIWAFAHGLNQALVADEKADGALKVQLGRLTNAAKTSSTEELKREALSVATGLADVFESRRKAQRAQAAEFGAQMAELGHALEEARRENALDPLTRLFNRKTFDAELTRVVDMSGIVGGDACLVVVDVDHFKPINDRYGHPAGDEVLRQLTGALSRTFRHREDVVARYGGEEFAVILRDTKLKDAIMLCDRLLAAVASLKIAVGDGRKPPITLTVSAGVSEHAPGESDAEWLSRTDNALYEAKRQGRNRSVVAAVPSRS